MKTELDDRQIDAINRSMSAGNLLIMREFARAIIQADRAQRQAEPVQLQHMAVAEGGVLRWMTGRKAQECELYAMPDKGRAPKLYTAPPAQVPEGYKLVPLEPTQAMLTAAKAWLVHYQHMREGDKVSARAQAYRAMLTAAPDVPLTDEGKTPAQEPLSEGVDVERLAAACSWMGTATPPSMEAMASDVAAYVNHLTRAVMKAKAAAVQAQCR